jgi:Tfp pilus assembly protein PilV
MRSTSKQGGFTLVVSALLISAVLLSVAAATAALVRVRESNDVTYANHLEARAAASSCLEIALLKRKQDETYAGNETVTTAHFSCTIRPIALGSAPTIETQATVGGATYRLRAQADASDGFTVTRWERVVNF